MKIRVRCLVMAVAVLCTGVALAQDSELPLKNWTAPPYWTPPRTAAESTREARMGVSAEGMTVQAESWSSWPLPFVAIAPCRIVDTRVATSDGFHQPNFGDDESRSFPLPTSTDCPGLPATPGAYSLNIQFRPMTQLAYLTAYPTGTTRPGVSTLTAGPAAWVENAAIVPAGTSGQIDVYCQYAGRVVIDVNGYYGSNNASNTFLGMDTGNFSMTGMYNTAIGYGSMHANTTGSNNTASGFGSLESNTTGYDNTASGYYSLSANTTGHYNTASGYNSLVNNTTGAGNTGSGLDAGYSNTTGDENTFLGYDANAAANNLTNATAIGYNAVVDASNHIRIGNGSVTQIGGQVAWSNLSDARAKSDIRDLDLGLDFVLALRPVSFTMKTGDGRTDMGFLAQDVEALLGDDYSVLGIGGDADRTLSLRYTDLIAPLVKAIQAQQAHIDTQQSQIDELRRQVQILVEARSMPAHAEAARP